MSTAERPPARRPFRIAAGVVAGVCFVLAALSRVALGDDWLFGLVVFLFVGLMMSGIAATGYWPRRR